MFSIIGNGHWGTAIAHYLSKHYPVEIIGRRQKKLPGDLQISQKTTLNDAAYDHWIYAAPTQMATSILKPVLETKQPASFLIASKGLIQNDVGQVMGLPDFICSYMDRVAMISGPSFASELMNDMPTFLVGATHHNALAKDMSQWFNHKPIHLTLSRDMLGVSFSGAFKNPIAILRIRYSLTRPERTISLTSNSIIAKSSGICSIIFMKSRMPFFSLVFCKSV